MTRVPRPCLGATNPATGRHEDCGTPVVGAGDEKVARCDKHRAWHELTRRPTPSRRGYDAQYRRDRAALLAGSKVCELQLPGCTYWADTADHVVPVSLGGKRSRLVPACKHCNSARGNRPLDAETPRPQGEDRGVGDRGVEDDGWFPPP